MSNYFEDFKEAYELYSQQKFDDSLAKLKDAEMKFSKPDIKGGVTLEDINILKGTIHIVKGDLGKALESFEKALKFNPDSPEASLGIGRVFYLADENEKAKTMIEWAAANAPDNESAVKSLKEINTVLGLPEDDNSLLKQESSAADEERKQQETEVSSAPEKQEPAKQDPLDEAYELYEKKQFRQALALLDEIEVDYKKRLASVENFRGFSFLGLDELKKAKESFETALKHNPDSSQAHAGLGEVSYMSTRDSEAHAFYQKALKLNPYNEFAKAGVEKTRALLESQDMNNVKKEKMEKLITDAYEDFNKKRFQIAIQKIERAEALAEDIGMNGKDMIVRFKNFKGFCLMGNSKFEEANDLFEESLKVDPESSQACAGLAELLFLAGNDEEAKQMYEHAVNNNPKNFFAVQGLAKVNRTLGLKDEHNNLLDNSEES